MITPETRQKLDVLANKLIDVYLDEADPDNWINEEKAKEQAAQMVAEGESAKDAAKTAAGWKGERYWEKKNANQTAQMLLNLTRLMAEQPAANNDNADEARKQRQKEVQGLERKVKKRLARTRPKLVVSNK